MPVTFSKSWAQEVADVSGSVEFQNAIIEIRDPTLITTVRHIQAGPSATVQSGNPVLWTGQARIANQRSALNVGGATSIDPTSYKLMVVQIPYTPGFMHVKRGWQVRVLNGGRNTALQSLLFSVESDVTTSNVASLTFHVSTDVEIVPNWIT